MIERLSVRFQGVAYLLAAVLAAAGGCVSSQHGPVAHPGEAAALPPQLQGRAVVLTEADADYARADLAGAVKPAGGGGLARGMVVRLTADVTVWRLWSGPARKDARGNTNRLGQWWAYDPPHGGQEGYRKDYEVCLAWNDLTWVARCTLKQGAVVAIGPGNSVSAQTCGDPSGREGYAANERDWQVWVTRAWARAGADKELDCPPEAADYQADQADIARGLHLNSTPPPERPSGQ